MHPAVAEDRVATHAVARRHAPARRPAQAARSSVRRRPRLRRTVPSLPQRISWVRGFPLRITPGIEQIADLHFAGGGALVGDDEVEFVVRADSAVEIVLAAERAQIDPAPPWPGARRRGPSGRGCAPTLPRIRSGVVSTRIGRGSSASAPPARVRPPARDRSARGTTAIERRGRVERGRRPSDDIDLGAGFDVRQRHRARRPARPPGLASSEPTPARSSMRAKLSPWASVATSSIRGRSGADLSGRTAQVARHVAAAVGAERERHDHLAAEFVALGIVHQASARRFDRGEIGPEQQAPAAARREHRARAAEPARAADVLGEVGGDVEPGQLERAALAPLAVAFGERIEAGQDERAAGLRGSARATAGARPRRARRCCRLAPGIASSRGAEQPPPSAAPFITIRERARPAPLSLWRNPWPLKVNFPLISARRVRASG